MTTTSEQLTNLQLDRAFRPLVPHQSPDFGFDVIQNAEAVMRMACNAYFAIAHSERTSVAGCWTDGYKSARKTMDVAIAGYLTVAGTPAKITPKAVYYFMVDSGLSCMEAIHACYNYSGSELAGKRI